MSAQLQQQSLSDFLAKYPITMELTEVPENPPMENSRETMINYHVILKREDQIMTLYFSTGLGWVETRSGKPARGITYRKRDKMLLRRSGNTLYDANAGSFAYRIKKPTVADVLDCLASDASGADESFEDWASDLGYDTDSRKAEQTYQTTQKQTRELRQLLGREAFDELLETERM